MVRRSQRSVKIKIPIKTSNAARSGRETDAEINPKESNEMAPVASSSAGLKPGKNFSAPNQINISAMLYRRNRMPFLAIQRVMSGSRNESIFIDLY